MVGGSSLPSLSLECMVLPKDMALGESGLCVNFLDSGGLVWIVNRVFVRVVEKM